MQREQTEGRYCVAGYFDEKMAGLEDSMRTDDLTEALDAAHEMACRGDFVMIRNTDTGKEARFSPDEWIEAVDLGDVPDSAKDLA